MAKKRNKMSGIPMYRVDQDKCMHWCLSNGIRIHINLGEEYLAEEWRTSGKEKYKVNVNKIKNPYEDGLVKIFVNNNGIIALSPKTYTQKEANLKIYEFYCHYYDNNK